MAAEVSVVTVGAESEYTTEPIESGLGVHGVDGLLVHTGRTRCIVVGLVEPGQAHQVCVHQSSNVVVSPAERRVGCILVGAHS